MHHAARLLFLVALAAAQDLCVPALVNPPITDNVFLLVTLRTHTIVVHGTMCSAVEYATGMRVVVAADCGFCAGTPDGMVMLFVDSATHSLHAQDALGKNRVQLSTGQRVRLPYLFASPDSQWVAFVDNLEVVGMYSVRVAGGPVTRLSPTTQNRTDGSDALATTYTWSPDSRFVAYLWKLAVGDPFRLFVATNGVAESAIEAMPGVTGSVNNYVWSADSSTLAVIVEGALYSISAANVAGTPVQLSPISSKLPSTLVYSPDGSRIAVRGNWEASGFVQRWYSATPGVAMSLVSVSNNTQFSTNSASNFGPGALDYNILSRLDGDTTQTALRADLSGSSVTQLVPLSGPGEDATFLTIVPPVVAYIGNGRAYRVSPTGNVLLSDPARTALALIPLPNNLLVLQGNVIVVDPLRDDTFHVVSRPQDVIVSLAVQPNSVSVVYHTPVKGEVVSSCAQPSTVVRGGTAFNATGSVPGHFVTESGGIVVFPGGAPLSVAGTAVLAGTLQLSNVCTSGTVAVLNATWVVGQFDQVQLTGCTGCSGGSATQSVSPASSSLSVTVSITCTGGGGGGSGGLSTGAIVGIAVGCVVGACLLGGGIALALKHQRTAHTALVLSSMKANHMANVDGAL